MHSEVELGRARTHLARFMAMAAGSRNMLSPSVANVVANDFTALGYWSDGAPTQDGIDLLNHMSNTALTRGTDWDLGDIFPPDKLDKLVGMISRHAMAEFN